jgi:D-galactarolactone cycloisomerase
LRFIAPDGSPDIGVYASGLNPDAPEKLAKEKQREGFTAFKLKVGFGRERDIANLNALRGALGNAALMADANQAWDLPTALAMVPHLEPYHLQWLEEPLRADSRWSEWDQLSASTQIPLAAGENIAGAAAFANAIGARVLRVVQPDLAKWGGFSGCVPVARAIRAADMRFCPHYLGGGIGLLASAHLLAAVGAPACSRSMPTPTHSGHFCVAHLTTWREAARRFRPKQVWETSQICPPWPASKFDTDNA